MRKQATYLTVLFATLMLVLTGCNGGGELDPKTVDGQWAANLRNADGSPAFDFTATLDKASDGSLTVSNFAFRPPALCFAWQTTTQAANLNLASNFNGNVAGAFGMTIRSSGSTPNTLRLEGGLSGNTIRGTWKLSGAPGCSANGAFAVDKITEKQILEEQNL